MKIDLTEWGAAIWDAAAALAVGVRRGVERLTGMWLLKSFFGVLAQGVIWLVHLKHFQILGVFTLLVVLDLVAKWSALAYKWLIENGHHDPDTLEKWAAIPAAWDAEYITSKEWRRSFSEKMLSYFVVTGAAAGFDFMAGTPGYACHLVWLYLGANEFLSILENLRDGGNKSMGRFLELVKDKLTARVKN